MEKAQKKALEAAIRREQLRRKAGENYYAYVQLTHLRTYKRSAVGEYLTERVQNFLEAETGDPYNVLIVTMPPQHGKSMHITETLPSWYLGRWPEKSVIEISYSDDFAEKFGLRNRQKLDELGEELFGVRLSKESRKKTDFEIAGHRGSMRSRGIGGGVTGNACDLMIIDDPIRNRAEADSPTMRGKLTAEWNDSFKSRLSAGAKVILILTRWHEEDLAGWLIRNDPFVEVLRLPCESEGEGDPLGRPEGAPLCPEIGKDARWLEGFKRAIRQKEGQRTWNALYQCRPTSEQGNLIRRGWWRRYRKETAPRMAQKIISIDAAFKGTDQNDYVAIQCWGKLGADVYLLEAKKQHMNFPETLAAVRAWAAKWPDARPIYIEDKANGPAIIDMLRHEIPGIVPITPEGGKVARVNAISAYIEAGNVWIPENDEEAEALIESCAAFPQGEHDDDVDAMSQALNRLYRFRGELPKEKDEDEGPDYDDQIRNMFF